VKKRSYVRGRETQQADDWEEIGVAAGEDWGEAVEAVPGNGRREAGTPDECVSKRLGGGEIGTRISSQITWGGNC